MNHAKKDNPPTLLNRLFTGLLEYIGSLLLFSMMLLTFVDVIARYFFSRSITGGFEITELMLATLIFCGLPLITLRDGHITVDLIERFLPAGFRAWRDRLVSCMAAVMLFFLGWWLWKKGLVFSGYNDQTAVLLIPLAPICFTMAVLAFASALIAAVFCVTGYRRRPDTPADTSDPLADRESGDDAGASGSQLPASGQSS